MLTKTIKASPNGTTSAAGQEAATPDVQAAHTVGIASVPDLEVVKRYVSRDFDDRTEFEVYDWSFSRALNVLNEGPTGPGKTMSVRAWAASRGKLFYSIPSNVGIEPSQIFGKYIPDEDNPGTFRWQDGGATTIVRNGGALLINEINFMPERVASALFGLLDERREIVLLDHKGEVVRAHRGGGAGKCWCNLQAVACDDKRVIVFADMNPDYMGTRPLNAALRNRFPVQLDWTYDPVVEAQLIQSTTLRLTIAPGLRKAMEDGRYNTPVSTNMLIEFERTARTMGLALAIRLFVNHFTGDERQAVRTVFEPVRANLQSELPLSAEAAGTDGDYNVIFKDASWVYADQKKGSR